MKKLLVLFIAITAFTSGLLANDGNDINVIIKISNWETSYVPNNINVKMVYASGEQFNWEINKSEFVNGAYEIKAPKEGEVTIYAGTVDPVFGSFYSYPMPRNFILEQGNTYIARYKVKIFTDIFK